MKTLTFRPRAIRDLRKLKGREGERIEAAIVAYAETGRGDVAPLAGVAVLRMRIGQRRVLFDETDDEIIVFAVLPRGQAYDKKALRSLKERR